LRERSGDAIDEVAPVVGVGDRIGAFVREPVAGDTQIGSGGKVLDEARQAGRSAASLPAPAAAI